MSKLPGKTIYSGRRRTTTRKSGFASHPNSTGGEYKKEKIETILLHKDRPLSFIFKLPNSNKNIYFGFGGYFKCDDQITLKIDNPNYSKALIECNYTPDWSKFGSMWTSNSVQIDIVVSFCSPVDTKLAIYGFSCGLIWSPHFENARVGVMKDMYRLSPEGNFYTNVGEVDLPEMDIINGHYEDMHLKSCNRCARFLPINLHNERNHLSFSNHCVARAPCRHKGFGKLRNIDNNEMINLMYGYQLECRFCKKYEVNAALNPQRTTAQMKEDSQRRRHFEILLTELYQKSSHLSYRHETGGRELSDDIWLKFDKKCFNCDCILNAPNDMHLDHTRPLALLWPLDETATSLCQACNSRKRDRYPSEYYSEHKLIELAKITGLNLQDLKSPEPNHYAIAKLCSSLDWLYDDFLKRPDLLKERDGKITAELLVKALDKVLMRSKEKKYNFSFEIEYKKRNNIR